MTQPSQGVPANVTLTSQSVRLVIQSRADEGDEWRDENDTSREDNIAGARGLLNIYRKNFPGREAQLSRRTMARYDEPLEG